MVSDRRDVVPGRLAWLHLLAVGSFLIIGARLAYLQLLHSETYTRLAETQRIRRSTLFPARGALYLSEQGSVRPALVATTRLAPTAYVVPREIRDLEQVVTAVADVVLRYEARATVRRDALLVRTGQLSEKDAEARRTVRDAGLPEERAAAEDRRREELKNDFKRRFGNRTDPYEPILPGGDRLDDGATAELQNRQLVGVAFRDVAERAYPEGSLAAHVLGFVRVTGAASRGEYGVEAGLDGTLRGISGFREAERDVVGRIISVGEDAFTPVENGADVVLTIDRVLQTIAEDIAREGRERFDAERTQVVIMDPNTGAVQALAASPSFDPNTPSAITDVGVFQNPVVADLFEPGSILKPVVMAAALEEKLVTPDTTVVDSGPLRIGPYTINTFDGKHPGVLTMTQVLEQSNNIGMVRVAQKIGAERLYQFLRRVGVGDRTGVPLAGEAAASLPVPDTWGETRTATIGFGQGLVTTPLNALVANAALVNGGRLLEPYLVREVRYPDGTTETVKPNVIRQVVRPEVSSTLRAMLASVVEKGVAQRAKVPGYYVGGKTGTAQVVDQETGRYSPDKKIISFIGFAPAENPVFIAMVKLDNPAGLSFASGTAAPLFSQLAKRALEYLRVPPDRLQVADPLHRRAP